MEEFKNRVFGCAMVKAINSNYNADFSGQPRTLDNGVVYATDKTYKYSVRNYLHDTNHRVFTFKSFNEDLTTRTLNQRYLSFYQDWPKRKETKGKKGGKEVLDKLTLAKNLLSFIDVRAFGLTFAGETNISIHGTLQVCHGVNIWKENRIYTEQISSPFSTEDDKGEGKENSTLGRQSRLEEGHYIHHFSINPQNLSALGIKDAPVLTSEDIAILKEAMKRGVSWYDSASKAGCENEMLVWVQLKEGSKIVLPNFGTLITLEDEKVDGKCVYNFSVLRDVLKSVAAEVESITISYNKQSCIISNIPEEATEESL